MAFTWVHCCGEPHASPDEQTVWLCRLSGQQEAL